MKTKIISASFFLMMAIILGGCNKDGEVDANSPIIFFYSWSCPHCKDVEKYFEEKKIEEKIKFPKGEIHNKNNKIILGEKAKICQIDEKNLGVPFLWAEGKCFMGPMEIEKYFNEKIGLNQK